MGYEQERFIDSYSPDLICSICLCVLEDPLECKTCQANFCSSCINQISNLTKKCKNQCELNLQKSHRFLRSTLLSLKLKCINTCFGCDSTPTVEEVKFHEMTECEYRQVSCQYEGCIIKLTFKDKHIHEESCQYKAIKCLNCNEDIYFKLSSTHSCILKLKEKTQNLAERFEENLKTLKILKENCRNKLDDLNGMAHSGVKCSYCGASPIYGVRNSCIQCEDHNLCWVCYRSPYNDHKFVQLFTDSEHFEVTCDGCYTNPIKGIRYNCLTCENFGKTNLDFCHKCKLKVPHFNHDFQFFVPFNVKIVPVAPDKISYKNGDCFIRQWEIFNNSTDIISDLYLECTAGDTCSTLYLVASYKINFPGLKVLPMTWNVLTIKESIFQPIPGTYYAEFRLRTTTRLSSFGPVLKYSLAVIPSVFLINSK